MTAAIAAFPPRAYKEAVHRFFSLFAYFRRFFKNFARIAEPLSNLAETDVVFMWEMPQEEAFG